MKKNRLYSGVNILVRKTESSNFGSVEGWVDKPNYNENIRVFLKESDKIEISHDEKGVWIKLGVEESIIFSEALRVVSENVKLLSILSKKDKLSPTAYIHENDEHIDY